MNKTDLIIRIISITLLVLLIVTLIVAVIVFHQLSKITVRQTKDYAEMYVDENDILDAEAIIAPPEKYSQLLQININMRKQVAAYMKKNNFKLKSGKQAFIRNNPSFKELIEEGFKFEKIKTSKQIIEFYSNLPSPMLVDM